MARFKNYPSESPEIASQFGKYLHLPNSIRQELGRDTQNQFAAVPRLKHQVFRFMLQNFQINESFLPRRVTDNYTLLGKITNERNLVRADANYFA